MLCRQRDGAGTLRGGGVEIHALIAALLQDILLAQPGGTQKTCL